MHVDFLRSLFEQPGPWATVYSGDPPVDESGAKERELAVQDLCRSLAERGADAGTVEAVRETLAGFAPADTPHGAVVFAAGGRVALWQALPRPVPAASAHWAPLPHLTPLVRACDPDVRCLVARIDRTGADFALRDAGAERAAGTVSGADYPVHRTGRNDWSEKHFQLKVENTWEHNAGEIAGALAEAADDCGADMVVLAGDPRERQEVFARLPEALRDRTTVSDHGGRSAGADSAELEQDVERARAAYARRRDARLLDRFEEGGGAGVAGVPALVDAAREHRIGTLLLRPEGSDLEREVWVGSGPEELSARRTPDEQVSAPAGDALLRAAVVTGAEVAVVAADRPEPGPADLEGGGAAGGQDADGGASPGAERDRLTGRAEHALVGGLGALPRWEQPAGGAA